MSFFPVRLRDKKVSGIDLLLVVGLVALIYALVGLAEDWSGPFRPKTEIDLSLASLVRYSFYSLVRVFLAYAVALFLTLTYGYAAAKSKIAEPVLVSLLDILQSVPVLGFMPGVVLALVSLFPHSNLGLECAAVLIIFTGHGWNMIFSFYSSVKNVPAELRDMTSVFRLRKRDVLRSVELPFAANGLLWNSMLSMAGGWFFLMVIESFTLGDKDFRLKGIGSYMAVAYERHDSFAVVAGIVAMFTLIVLVDRCLWAPLVVWSERFKFDRGSSAVVPRSMVLDWLQRSRFFARRPSVERDRRPLAATPRDFPEWPLTVLKIVRKVLTVALVLAGLAIVLYGARSLSHLLGRTSWAQWLTHGREAGLTLLRVSAAVVLGSLWTIPAGVFIGIHPRWTLRLQPIVQIVAAFPAPMLFPLVTVWLLRAGLGLQTGSVVLMLLASQWYILFNVISGASQIPHQMIDVAGVFRVRGFAYWRMLILPAIFPSLVNGWITAAGGAWNASIVSEVVSHGTTIFHATGIGASITEAARSADYANLAASILVMVTTVVILNRFFWDRLFRLAELRFRLDMP